MSSTSADSVANQPTAPIAFTPADSSAISAAPEVLEPADSTAAKPADPVDVVPADSAATTLVVPVDSAVAAANVSEAPKDSAAITPVDSTASLPKDSVVVPLAYDPQKDLLKYIYKLCNNRPCTYSADLVSPDKGGIHNVALDEPIQDSAANQSIANIYVKFMDNQPVAVESPAVVPQSKADSVSCTAPQTSGNQADSSQSQKGKSGQEEMSASLAESKDTAQTGITGGRFDLGTYAAFLLNYAVDESVKDAYVYGIDVGGYLHLYFKDWLSLDAGVAMRYQASYGNMARMHTLKEETKLRNEKFLYTDLGVDIPLNVRFGGNQYILFASLGEDFYKPLYKARFYQVQDDEGSYLNVKTDYGAASGLLFDTYLGVGVELRKYFVLHYQFLLASGSTGGYVDFDSRSFARTWKLTLQYYK